MIVTKRARLNLDKWVGNAPDDGLTTEQALQELRGCPVPWTGSEREKRIFALPHGDALAVLAKPPSKASPEAALKRSAARQGRT